MGGIHAAAWMSLLALWLLGPGQVRADEPPMTIADLARYREALEDKHPEVPTPVGFRELWSAPERYRGKRVRVEGRVARAFQQGKVGTFPPLTELWTVSQAGDPLCLVFPRGAEPPGLRKGDDVQFTGTFLRVVPYEGGDGRRLAPLIVGGKPPTSIAKLPAETKTSREFSALDWTIGIAAAAFVAAILSRQHLRKPSSRARRNDLAEPQFIQEP